MARPIITLGRKIAPKKSKQAPTDGARRAQRAMTPPVKKPPKVVERDDRRAVVKPVNRTGRYLCVVMGLGRPGVTKVYRSLGRARRDAVRMVAFNPSVDHCFVAHIVESAKLDAGEDEALTDEGVKVATKARKRTGSGE